MGLREGGLLYGRRRRGWSVGSKLMATAAALILITGVVLTLLTMNANVKLEAYRPVIFTILGILFIVIGPIVVCRMVLNAYDRRLAREQRQFEYLTRLLRRREGEEEVSAPPSFASAEGGLPRRAQMAVHLLLGAAGIRRPARQSTATQASGSPPEGWFPESLPTYEDAVELQEDQHKHWMAKFFDYQKAPPPPYRESVELETFSFQEIFRSAELSPPPTYPLQGLVHQLSTSPSPSYRAGVHQSNESNVASGSEPPPEPPSS